MSQKDRRNYSGVIHFHLQDALTLTNAAFCELYIYICVCVERRGDRMREEDTRLQFDFA